MTNKQSLFIENYLIHFNATRAAVEAGYSENSAQQTGFDNLLKPVIRKVLDKRIKEIIDKTDDKRVKLIRFWEKIIDDKLASENYRMKASENLGKYLAMFTERLELSTKEGHPIEIKWK